MNIFDIAHFMNSETTRLDSCSYEDVRAPFDILPQEYLEFMENDLKDSDRRSRVNALSNAKRSLDCQVESLLFGFCLKEFTDFKKMSIPLKLKMIEDVGIVAPRILRKINKIRNTMEHDFYCPEYEEVQDFADVILLFNSYTDRFIHGAKCDCEIVDEGNDELWIRTKFDRENQSVTIRIVFREKEDEEITIKPDKNSIEGYVDFLKYYIQLASEF